jgi:hypothetical protein
LGHLGLSLDTFILLYFTLLYVSHTSEYVTGFNSSFLVFSVAGCRNISNALSIGTKIDRSSAELKEVAQKHGLWDGQVSVTGFFCDSHYKYMSLS